MEDDEKIRDVFSRLLKLRGYQVQEANDGEQAVALATQGAFDVVFMDIKMPKLDGLSAYRQIRTSAPTTKVVLLTGFSIHEDLQQLLDAGQVECLRKPFSPAQLDEVLARLTPPSPPPASAS